MSAEQGDDAGGQDSTTSAAVVARSHDGPQASPNGDASFVLASRGNSDGVELPPFWEGSLDGEAARSQQDFEATSGFTDAAVQGLTPTAPRAVMGAS